VDLVALIGALFRDPAPDAIERALAAAAAAHPADDDDAARARDGGEA
jgi:hypothetical protein